jgi:hypothetical protein
MLILNYAYILFHGFYVPTLVEYQYDTFIDHMYSNEEGLDNNIWCKEREWECHRKISKSKVVDKEKVSAVSFI